MKILKKNLEILIKQEIDNILKEQQEQGGFVPQASGELAQRKRRQFVPKQRKSQQRLAKFGDDDEEVFPFAKKFSDDELKNMKSAGEKFTRDTQDSVQDDVISHLSLRIADAVERLIDMEAVLDDKVRQLKNLEDKVDSLSKPAAPAPKEKTNQAQPAKTQINLSRLPQSSLPDAKAIAKSLSKESNNKIKNKFNQEVLSLLGEQSDASLVTFVKKMQTFYGQNFQRLADLIEKNQKQIEFLKTDVENIMHKIRPESKPESFYGDDDPTFDYLYDMGPPHITNPDEDKPKGYVPPKKKKKIKDLFGSD